MSTEPSFGPFGGANPALRALVQGWYEKHQTVYETKVWPQLAEIRRTWARQDRQGKRALLQGSYVFTILTQRVDTTMAEATFRDFLAGDPIFEAMKQNSVGPDAKVAWIMQSLWDPEPWNEAISLIDDGNYTKAHSRLMETITGLAAAKSGFIMANVGVTQKMCIDANVARILRIDPDITDECDTDGDCDDGDQICLTGQCVDDPADLSDVEAEEYNRLCGDVMDMFPDMTGNEFDLDQYELQWVLFDIQRYYRFGSSASPEREQPVATHEGWFDVANGQTVDLKARMRRAETRAEAVWEVINTDPEYADWPKSFTRITHSSRATTSEIPVILDKADDRLDPNYDDGPDPGQGTLFSQLRDQVSSDVERDAIQREMDESVDDAVSD